MKKLTLILLAIIIILVILAIFQGRRVSKLSYEVKRQERNVEVLRDHERLYKICDSINVAEIQDTIMRHFIVLLPPQLVFLLIIINLDTEHNKLTVNYISRIK